MTVEELIIKLKDYPQDALVVVGGGEFPNYYSIGKLNQFGGAQLKEKRNFSGDVVDLKDTIDNLTWSINDKYKPSNHPELTQELKDGMKELHKTDIEKAKKELDMINNLPEIQVVEIS